MAKLGRPPAEVVLTNEERFTLVRLTKRSRVNRALAFRARIVLACADASDTVEVRRLRTILKITDPADAEAAWIVSAGGEVVRLCPCRVVIPQTMRRLACMPASPRRVRLT